jgi:hypothetical protein
LDLSEPLDIGVFTVVRDDRPLLPEWLAFWQQAVGADRLLIFDDTSAGVSVGDLRCTVFRLPTAGSPSGTDEPHVGLVNGFAVGLLEGYDWIVSVRPSEVLIPDPAEFDDLADYLEKRSEQEVIAPVGVRPLRDPGSANGTPTLRRDGLALFVPDLCRPMLKRVRAPWLHGGRGIAKQYRVDPGLVLIDLVGVDHPAPADPAHVAEFPPAEQELAGLVERDGAGGFRVAESAGERLMRLPDRIRVRV